MKELIEKLNLIYLEKDNEIIIKDRKDNTLIKIKEDRVSVMDSFNNIDKESRTELLNLLKSYTNENELQSIKLPKKVTELVSYDLWDKIKMLSPEQKLVYIYLTTLNDKSFDIDSAVFDLGYNELTISIILQELITKGFLEPKITDF